MTDAPVEVALAVQPVLDQTRNAEVSTRWCERLLEMYRKWAARRGMQVSEVGVPESRLNLFVISGFGAARLLSPEAGLHVLDYEDSDDAGRTVARVTVKPTPLVAARIDQPSNGYCCQRCSAKGPRRQRSCGGIGWTHRRSFATSSKDGEPDAQNWSSKATSI